MLHTHHYNHKLSFFSRKEIMYVDENNMQEQKENIRKRNKALALIQNPLKQLLKVAKVKEEAAVAKNIRK